MHTKLAPIEATIQYKVITENTAPLYISFTYSPSDYAAAFSKITVKEGTTVLLICSQRAFSGIIDVWKNFCDRREKERKG
jgi:hypothetical protein